MQTIKCTISGSFRRFLSEIEAKVKECRDHGIDVLSPQTMGVNGESEDFVFLQGDSGTPKDIEIKHLRAICNSDFLYVVNPGGYIGTSTTLEIGYALAYSVPIFCHEIPSEYILSLFIEVQPSIEKVKHQILGQGLPEIPKGADLSVLQAYIRKMVQVRNFHRESLRDVVLLLVEEIGELAKAVRWEVGLMIDLSKAEAHKSISHELADCLIYLLDAANLANIDLESALREKEKINATKRWG